MAARRVQVQAVRQVAAVQPLQAAVWQVVPLRQVAARQLPVAAAWQMPVVVARRPEPGHSTVPKVGTAAAVAVDRQAVPAFAAEKTPQRLPERGW